MAPSNDQVLYAAFEISSDIEDDMRLFRSDNGGQSWDELNNAPNACGTQCFATMMLAIDPTNPDTLYVGGSGNYGFLDGYELACNQFDPLPPSCNATLMRSTDAGASWADIGENGKSGPLHPDAHAILFDPKNRAVIYFGTDGGLFHTADGGQTWNDLNHGLGTLQVDNVAVDHDGNVYAGTQDNGSFAYSAANHSW